MHTGFSLHDGHYFVFVLSREVPDRPQWLVLDDQNVHCITTGVATGSVVPDPTAVPCEIFPLRLFVLFLLVC